MCVWLKHGKHMMHSAEHAVQILCCVIYIYITQSIYVFVNTKGTPSQY